MKKKIIEKTTIKGYSKINGKPRITSIMGFTHALDELVSKPGTELTNQEKVWLQEIIESKLIDVAIAEAESMCIFKCVHLLEGIKKQIQFN